MAKGDPLLPAPISFVVGPLGSGKSYFAMRYIRKYVKAGKMVAANFDLCGDWAKTWSGGGILDRWFGTPENRYAWSQEARSRVLRYDMQDDLYDYELPGEGEDRGLLVLDEAGLSMNARMYAQRQKRDAALYGDKAALKSLEFYINMRKRGWTALVLAHSHSHLDNQVRDMGGQIVKLRNLARIKIPFTPFKMARKPRFVAIHIVPDTKPAMVHKREIYGLDMTTARHYQSMQTFDADPEIGRGVRLQVEAVKIARHPSQPVYTFDAGPLRRRVGTTSLRGGPKPAAAGSAPEGWTGSAGSWRDSSAEVMPDELRRSWGV